ncbi:hypothetical protein Tsp_03836 [Trichinella spiralis]|uniref:hypothetical protein n=1 Tax=Trichinella spiralis TaxID=6334 RepID=UPI0001EFC2D2|nr:hypothetical protein Tsp_03836 [Trichinella spiralis]
MDDDDVHREKNLSSSQQDTIFDFIYREDVDSLAKAIDKQPSLLTETSDNELGPLEFALFHGKSSSVDVLLTRKKCPLRDALFFAILLDDRPTMSRILDMSKKTEVHPIGRIFFPCYFTPIMMAAILERDYAYMLLRDTGHSLHSLRLAHCKCQLCLTDGWKDCGPSQLAVIHRHQSLALASESRLLCPGQRDPIQACFVLCNRLDWLIENYSSEEAFYLNIRDRDAVPTDNGQSYRLWERVASIRHGRHHVPTGISHRKHVHAGVAQAVDGLLDRLAVYELLRPHLPGRHAHHLPPGRLLALLAHVESVSEKFSQPLRPLPELLLRLHAVLHYRLHLHPTRAAGFPPAGLA